MFNQGIVITVTFKMLYTFLLKRQSEHYTINKFGHSNNSNGKDLTILSGLSFSRYNMAIAEAQVAKVATCERSEFEAL